MDTGREGRLLELLLDRLRLQTLQTGRAHERACVHEAAQLVAREQRLLERRVARQPEVLRVGENRHDDLLRVALLTQDRRPVLRTLVARRWHLVGEVVQQRRDPPLLLVLAELARVGGGGRLDREGMSQKRLALRVARQGLPGAFAGRLHSTADPTVTTVQQMCCKSPESLACPKRGKYTGWRPSIL